MAEYLFHIGIFGCKDVGKKAFSKSQSGGYFRDQNHMITLGYVYIYVYKFFIVWTFLVSPLDNYVIYEKMIINNYLISQIKVYSKIAALTRLMMKRSGLI